MASSHLNAYLNDHLAGSAAALSLLSDMTTRFAGSAAGQLAAKLHEDVSFDQRELEALMARLGIPQSGPRQAVAWLAEKMSLLKMRLEDPASGGFRLFESAEALSVGVEGKRLLWIALAAVAERDAALQGPDYATLIRRAEEQRCELESLRIEASRTAFAAANNAAGVRDEGR